MVPPPHSRPHRCAGAAIVLVLSLLVLLTVVVVAFFINANADLQSSKGYADEIRVKMLGASAVNVVEGQIGTATKGVDATGNQPLAWASQPGMVRTYDTKGNAAAAYKLYSSDTLQVQGAFSPATMLSHEVPPDWNVHPSDFVDLNSPEVVSDPNGALTDPSTGLRYRARFPIVDGNNLALVASNAAGAALSYDSNGDGAPDVEGFAVTPQTATYNKNNLIAPNNNPVPMPVRWLYMLKDGQLHARTPADGAGTAAAGTIENASATNPVVGRIAFWTDDDTAKLNVNTASEGTFWDRPWAKTQTELNFSQYYPVQNEFQMFTGHPAKTCLSTVLGSLWGVDPVLQTPYTTSTNYQKLLPYYDLVPRVTEGATNGSAGGTRTSSATNGISYDGDRLYASLDELMFRLGAAPDNTTRLTRNAPYQITVNNSSYTVPAISPQFLETTRFFLTASNRAPELTLFNTPRISLWPIQADPSFRTAKDQLLAFCATIPTSSSNYFFFQRATATLSAATNPAVPSMSCESMTQDANLPRNQQLYSYLQTLLSSDVPGLGGNFTTKYGAGPTAQIEAEMVDQIRSGVNTIINPTVTPAYSYTEPRANEAEGQVVPLQESNGRGFGRFNTIVEAAVDFFRCNDPNAAPTASNPTPKTADIQLGAALVLQPFNPSPGFPTWSPKMRIEIDGLQNFSISAATKPLVPMGFPSNSVNVVNCVTGGTDGTNSTEFNGTASLLYFKNGSVGTVKTCAPNPATSTDTTKYPFYNNQAGCTFPSTTTSFTFNGGTIRIAIYTSPSTPGATKELVQTLNITFPPSANLPVPTFQTYSDSGKTTSAAIFQGRVTASDGQPVDPSNVPHANILMGLFGQQDVVRSMIVDPNGPSKGDYRVVAALSNVPANYFAPHPFYNFGGGLAPGAANLDPNPGNRAYNWRFAHNMRTGMNPGYSGLGWYDYGSANISNYLDVNPKTQTTPQQPSTVGRKPGYRGSLVANLPTTTTTPPAPPYYPDASPAVPPGLAAATMTSGAPGDWDSGYGILEDGPYINKPDEANGQAVAGYAAAFDTTAYFLRGNYSITNAGIVYSPNRQISSGVAFGSLPTGIDQTTGATINPWQTLLFCANPPAGTAHPGFGVPATTGASFDGYPAPPYKTPPDHYILDLFTMPVVEPYAISEPLSTQGKVNMNYQIAPFTYIRRDTGLRAVMKSTWVTAVPTNASRMSPAGIYKANTVGGKFNGQIRYRINPDESTGTLKAFEDRFTAGELFRSASEICGVPLVPQQIPGISPGYPTDNPPDPTNASFQAMSAWWDNFKLTGDNEREAPYGDLYPRLTTKSNTFTVHVRVQTVKKTPQTAQTTFVDPFDPAGGAKDIVTAEYRGSYQIERYVDPNVTVSGNADPTKNFPDYAAGATTPIANFYKFHTIGAKQF